MADRPAASTRTGLKEQRNGTHRSRPGLRKEAARPGETERQVLGMARGGGLNLFGAVCSQAAQLGVTLLVGRALGQASLGRYAQAFAFLSLLGLLSLSGFRSGLTRFVAVHLAERKMGALRGTMRLGIAVSTVGASLLGVGLWFAAPLLAQHVFHDPALLMPLRFVAITLPAATYTDAALAATQGFRTQKPFALIGLIFQPLAQGVLTAALVAAGLGLRGAMLALVITEATSALLAAIALRRLVGRPQVRPSYDVRRLFGFSMVTWVASLATTGLVWADTIMLGALRTAKEVGQYNVATRLVMLAVFVAPPITASFGPHIADLHHRGRTEALRRVYGVATSWIVRLSLPAFVLLLAFPRELLELFGKGFAVGAMVTVILAGGKLIDAATGPCGLMLNMSGRPQISMLNNVCVLIINVALNLALIPRYGIVGSAVAWAVSLALVNLARVLQVWISMHMLPFDIGVLKGLTAGSAALAAALLVRNLSPLQGPLVLVAGVPAVVGCYAALVIAQGITDEDRLILKPLLRKFGLGKLVKVQKGAPARLRPAAAPTTGLVGTAAPAPAATAIPAAAPTGAAVPAASAPAAGELVGAAAGTAAGPLTPPPLPDSTGSWSLFSEMPLVEYPAPPIARRGPARAGRRRQAPVRQSRRPKSSYALWQRLPRPRPAFSLVRQARLLRRRGGLVAAGLLLGLAVGLLALPAVLSLSTQPGWKATVRIEVQPLTTEVASATGAPRLTAEQFARSVLTGPNAVRTVQRLGPDAGRLSATRALASVPARWPGALLAHLHAETASLSDRTVDLTYADADRRLASEVVQRYADAFVLARNGYDQSHTRTVLRQYQQQLATLQETVVSLRQQPGASDGADPVAAANLHTAEQRYRLLQTRSNQLREQALLRDLPTAAPLPASVARAAAPFGIPFAIPSSRLLQGAAGLLLGLCLGVAAALLAEAASPRLASAADVEAAVGSDLAAWVPGTGRRRSPAPWPVIAGDADPMGPQAEAYRRLVVALERRGLGHELLVLAVVSPAGGEGRSSVSANLARELARAGRGVVLVSGDLYNPAVERAYGIDAEVGAVPGLANHLAGTRPEVLALLVAARENLMVLPAGTAGGEVDPSELLDGNQPAEVIDQLRRLGLTVVVDTPPGNWSPDGVALAAVADAVVVVARAGRSRWRVMAAFAAALRTGHFPVAGAVLLGGRRARRAAASSGPPPTTVRAAPASAPAAAPAPAPAAAPASGRYGDPPPAPMPPTATPAGPPASRHGNGAHHRGGNGTGSPSPNGAGPRPRPARVPPPAQPTAPGRELHPHG